MILEILKMGDPRLLKPARAVEDIAAPEVGALVADMYETMHAAGGVGLAAPQSGCGPSRHDLRLRGKRALSRRSPGPGHHAYQSQP